MAIDVVTLALATGKAKAYTDTAISHLGQGMKYKGSVETVSDLPTAASGNKGHLYTIESNGHEYVSDGTQWIDLSADLENKQDKLTAGDGISLVDDEIGVNFNLVATNNYVDEQVGYKQDTLTAGTGISIVNNTISVNLDNANGEEF